MKIILSETFPSLLFENSQFNASIVFSMEVRFSAMTQVTIVVLTFNRSSLIKKLITELLSLTYHPLEIIIVDNHSEDETEEIVNSFIPDVRYFRTEINLGATARNIGLENAKGEVIITLDDDISGLKTSDIDTLNAYFHNNSDGGAVCFKVLDQKTGSVCNWVHHCDPYIWSNKEFLTYEITEGAVAFRKEALLRSGLYPSEYFISHEGPDLAFRLIDNGYKVFYTNKVCVFHSHSLLGRKNWMNYYYDTRNQLWLAARHLPFTFAAAYLTKGLGAMFVYSLRDGFFSYFTKALVDGIRGLGPCFQQRKTLSKKTMSVIRQIDRHRPNLIKMIKKRLFSAEVRL